MPSCLRPAALGAALVLGAVVAPAAEASPPPVPPVAEIPVAPMTPQKKRAPVVDAKATTTVVTTTTTTVPALVAVAAVPQAPPASGAAEAMPAAPPPLASAHVILVDELPFRATRTHARDLPEHAHHSKRKGRHGRPFHPAPGIVVDVSDANGGASAEDLQRGARNVGYWPFRHCYEEGLRRDQHEGGKVSLDLGVSPGGSVQSASVIGSTLPDESVALCVAREAAHLTLASGEAQSSAKMEVHLSTGDEPVPVPRPVPHADDLRDALRTSWPAVKQCYANAVASHPGVGGRMVLRIHVRRDGAIEEVSEEEPRFGDVEVTRCVFGVYRNAKLPAMGHGSRDETFDYAMHFEARQ